MKTMIYSVVFLLFNFLSYGQNYIFEDFEAKANHETDNAFTIQKAIDECTKNGGGVVILSQGLYHSGTLHIKSNVSLKICANSVLKALEDSSAIKKSQSSVISRMDVVPWKSFIHAESETNIRIFGGGTIDGSGDAACFQDCNLLYRRTGHE